jgi:UPF0755 protein
MLKFKKLILVVLFFGAAFGGYLAYHFLFTTTQKTATKYIYIQKGSNAADVANQLQQKGFIKSVQSFNKVAGYLNYKKNVLPGRYEVVPGQSMYALVRMLRSGAQSPVNFVINKILTNQEFVKKVAENFEVDSASIANFIYNADSLKTYNVDTANFLTLIIPNTYSINWNSPIQKIVKKLATERDKFWTAERIQKAKAHNLTPNQVYALASIVEEETNLAADKPKVASVYLNRLETGMKLEADPTLKFAIRNFGLKRVLNIHKETNSPYNTYKNTGIPPGPICTPQISTIDATLNAPQTDYLFFVAEPNLSGRSKFASTYAQHQIYAKEYQAWIGEYLKNKQAKENEKKQP